MRMVLSKIDSLLKQGKFTNRILVKLNWSRPLANTKKHSNESYLNLNF